MMELSGANKFSEQQITEILSIEIQRDNKIMLQSDILAQESTNQRCLPG